MTIIWGQGTWGQGPYGGGPAGSVALTGKALAVGYACAFELSEATGDLVTPLRLIRGPLAIAQKMRSCLRFFKAEWFLDQRLGIDYFRYVLIKNPKLPIVNSLIRNALRKVRGVANVSNVVTTFDRANRSAVVAWNAVLDDGSTLTAENEPFVVQP